MEDREVTADIENIEEAAEDDSFVVLAHDHEREHPVAYGPCSHASAMEWLARLDEENAELSLEGRTFTIVPLITGGPW